MGTESIERNQLIPDFWYCHLKMKYPICVFEFQWCANNETNFNLNFDSADLSALISTEQYAGSVAKTYFSFQHKWMNIIWIYLCDINHVYSISIA